MDRDFVFFLYTIIFIDRITLLFFSIFNHGITGDMVKIRGVQASTALIPNGLVQLFLNQSGIEGGMRWINSFAS
jgi:hypothetical protein